MTRRQHVIGLPRWDTRRTLFPSLLTPAAPLLTSDALTPAVAQPARCMAMGRLQITWSALVLAASLACCHDQPSGPVAERLVIRCTAENLKAGFKNRDTYRDVAMTTFPPRSSQQLTEECSELPVLEERLKSYRSDCNVSGEAGKHLLLEVEGLLAAWQYVCGPGRPVFPSWLSCQNHSEVQDRSRMCQESFRADTWFLSYHHPYETAKLKTWCLAREAFLPCIQKAVGSGCEDSVARWQREIHFRRWQPVDEATSCSVDGSLTTGAVAIVCICGSAALYVIIWVIIALVNRAKQNKQKKLMLLEKSKLCKSKGGASKNNLIVAKDTNGKGSMV